MAEFLTRVELHHASAADYEKLHAEMVARKFYRDILGSDGVRYALPTAEYRSFGDITVEYVRDLAIDAANATGRAAWVLTVKYDGAAWRLAAV